MELLGLEPKTVYEWATWVVVILIDIIMLFMGYLFCRLARIPNQRKWRNGFYAGAVACVVLGLVRLIVVLAYYEDYSMRFVIPLTAMISWSVIGAVSYAVVRYIENAVKKVRFKREEIELTDAIFDNVVDPLVRGEKVTPADIEHYAQKSMSLAAR